MSVRRITLDPDAKKRISFDWTPWLTNESTSISSFVLTPSTGVTIHSDDETGGVVTALVSAEASGRVTCHIVCADAQEDDKTMYISVRDA